MKRVNLIKLLGCACLLLLAGCFEQSYEESKNQRILTAQNSKDGDPIVIGVPWLTPDKQDTYINGVKLAVKDINAKGGVFDSPLQVVFKIGYLPSGSSPLSDSEFQELGLDAVNSFTDDPNLVAVLGHGSSTTALRASVIYHNAGILFISPITQYSKFTGHNFDNTFRIILNNEKSAKQIAEYAVQKKYKNVAVLHSRGSSSTELAGAFASHASEKGINIVYRHSFFDNSADFISLIIALKNIQQFDAIFIAAHGELSAKLYDQIRNMGIKQPILGGEHLDTKAFLKLVGKWEKKVKDDQKSSIATVFNAASPEGQAFTTHYRQEYGLDEQPDYLAALGYDIITLFAHGIQLAQSVIPIEIATTLHYMAPCKGITGVYEFEPNGDLKNKSLFFKRVSGHDFVYEQLANAEKIDESRIPVCNDIDRDHDTIPDNTDACPDSTPAEKSKGIELEGASKGCPLDTDDDDKPDYKDKCPNNTSREISEGVDANGCPIDSDKDGEPDYSDSDIDGDHVPNTEDLCPKNNAKELVYGVNMTGNKGCPVDSDGDSLPDYLDDCQKNTVAEISKGVNDGGCPTDKDGDGVLDYQDKCLHTPEGFPYLIDEHGCEVSSSVASQKSASLFFAEKKSKLIKPGIRYLDALLKRANVEMLNKIEIIGYAEQQDEPLAKDRLRSIANYFQEKAIPAGKIETIVYKGQQASSKESSETAIAGSQPAAPADGAYMDNLQKEMQQLMQGIGIEIKRTAENTLNLSMSGSIIFDLNSENLSAHAAGALDSIAGVLNKYSDPSITVIGHTDDLGNDAYNQRLSEKRAAVVADHLAQHGIDQSRLGRQGMGEKMPRVANTSDENRAQNRRVELAVVAGPQPSAEAIKPEIDSDMISKKNNTFEFIVSQFEPRPAEEKPVEEVTPAESGSSFPATPGVPVPPNPKK